MQTVFNLPETVSVDQLLEALPLAYAEPKKERVKRCYLDTFDGRLHGVDWLLYQEGDELVLERNGERDRFSFSGRIPLLAADLDQSPAARSLQKVIENRALLPVLETVCESCRWPLVDSEQKSHLSLEYQQLSTPQGSHCDRIVLRPMRGYEKSLRRCARALEKMGCAIAPSPLEEWLFAALPDWPKPPRLRSDQAAYSAFCAIAHYQLEVMVLNEPGVLTAEDVEFLHDFRVALRRTRSLIGQLKGVLSAEVTERFKADFSWLGAQTGRVRDLDVWQEQLHQQSAELPADLRAGLEPLLRFIQNDRKRLKRGLDKVIEGSVYGDLKNRWRTLLEEQAETTQGVLAGEPIGKLAARQLYKRIGRVLKDGSAITEASPDEELHTLRIDCKKVRYLLEFFGSLFRGRSMKRMIKQLKRLQSTLGDFQDISTQRHNLNDTLDRMKRQKRTTPECLMATGALLSHLQQEHDRLRAQFFKEFEKFSDPGLSGAVLKELKAQKEPR